MSRGGLFARLAVVGLLSLAGTNAAAQQGAADQLLNRFYALQKSNPKAALAALETAAARFPRDIRIHMEIGYFTLAAGDKARALRAFRAAASLEPQRAELWRQIGYIENDLGHYESALAAFEEALRLEPGNDQVRVEIAYLQDRLERKRAAADNFRLAMYSKDLKLAEQACGAYSNLRGPPTKILPKPWFAEYYAAPEYRGHYGVYVFPFEGRVGASFGEKTVVEPYASIRATYDTRSGNGSLGPQIYYDNAAIPAAGIRVQPHVDIPVLLFAEAGAGYDILPRNRPRWRDDVRAGFVAAWEWNTGFGCSPRKTFPLRPVFDVYADGAYYTRYQNFISYGRIRPGLRLVEIPALSLDVYGLVAATIDARRIVDNRQLEVGGGIALKLYDLYGLTLRGEIVQVFRMRNGGYHDFRLRAEHAIRF